MSSETVFVDGKRNTRRKGSPDNMAEGGIEAIAAGFSLTASYRDDTTRVSRDGKELSRRAMTAGQSLMKGDGRRMEMERSKVRPDTSDDLSELINGHLGYRWHGESDNGLEVTSATGDERYDLLDG